MYSETLKRNYIAVISSKEDKILTKFKILTIESKYLSMSKKIQRKLEKSNCKKD